MSDQSKMLAKFINEGTRLEMQALEREDSGTENKPKIYASKICDIISEDTIEIMMPMEQQKSQAADTYNCILYRKRQCLHKHIGRKQVLSHVLR